MCSSPYPVELSEADRIELEALGRSRTTYAALAQQARMILAMADGEPYSVLSERFETSTTTLTRY